MKELFVFGAGASHASGNAPLGKDLVWSYFEDCSLMYEMGTNGKPTQNDLDQKRKEFQEFGEFLKAIEDIFPNISEYNKWQRCMNEALVHEPQIDKKYYIDEIMDVLYQRGDNKNIELIKRLTVEHIAKSTYTSRNLLYEKFVESLHEKSSQEISVISFNFDCLLQEDFKKKINFDYLLDFKYIDGNRRSYEKCKGFPLIKLNGSLDWAWNTKTDELTLLFPHITHLTYANKEAQIEPYIFFPHQHKSGAISFLWDRAREEIKSSSKITIIGYSFPHYDIDVIQLFRDNINSNTEITVIDYCWYSDKDEQRVEFTKKDIENKYKRLFPQINNFTIFLDGFEGYIKRRGQVFA